MPNETNHFQAPAEDPEYIRFYRGKSAARVRASTILDAYMLLHLAGKGEEIHQLITEGSYELRVPPGLVNLLKDRLVEHNIHTVSPIAASIARSAPPTCNDHPPPANLVLVSTSGERRDRGSG